MSEEMNESHFIYAQAIRDVFCKYCDKEGFDSYKFIAVLFDELTYYLLILAEGDYSKVLSVSNTILSDILETMKNDPDFNEGLQHKITELKNECDERKS